MDCHAFKHIWPLLVERGAAALDDPRVLSHPLTAAYQPLLAAGGSRPFVLGQLGQSLDGRIATPTGQSRDINGAGALDHLHRLRALVDAVIVGAGTVVADDPRLTTRRVPGPSPARVVIDMRGRSRLQRQWQAADGSRLIVFSDCPDWPPGIERIASREGDGRFAPPDIVAALAARGLRRLLVEGGAATVSGFLAAGSLNRLHLLVAPLILGSGRVGLALPPIDAVDEATRPVVTRYALGDDMLFDCAFRR